MRSIVVSMLVLTSGLANGAEAPAIGSSSRDDLFAPELPAIVCSDPIKTPGCSGICTDMKLNYDEMKHVNGRDADPKHGLAKPERYDLNNLEQRKFSISIKSPNDVKELKKQPTGTLFTFEDADREDSEKENEPTDQVTTYEVGHPGQKDCKWATIWVHGATQVRGGLGMADNLFGGAFNRMKHLAQDNKGVYYSPTIQDFEDDSGVEALVKYVRQKSCPNGKIVVNCGSAGTELCWKLAHNPRVGKDVAGLVVIGSVGSPDDNFLKTDTAKARIPILFSQGEHDHPDQWQKFVANIHKQDPTYPIRFLLYKDGGHMTPLRMLDWKSTMNCMLNQAPAPPSGGGSAPSSSDPATRATQ